MTPQELKLSILLRAFKGKLVEQNPGEGNGNDLYLKISKLNPVKKKVVPFENEPFDIPESWMWCSLNELAKIVVGATPSTSRDDYWNNGKIPWIPSGCCKDSSIDEFFPQIKYITQRGYDSCSTVLMEPSTVVIALTGATAGKVGILRFEACGNQSVVGIKPFDGLLPEFVFYCLIARRSEILGDCVGSAQPHISKEYITKMLFPLPPFEEQKRIVAKIEELLPLVDRYEKAWNKLELFNKKFPIDMEKSIAKLAIEGKLVNQIESEGSGELVLEEIKKTKQKLIKSKIIKQEKEFDPINEDERPYDIPSSWCWARFGELGSYKKGPFGSALTKDMFVPKGPRTIKVYEQKNAIKKDATLGDYYIKESYFEDHMKGFEIFPGDIIVSCAGTIGETYVLPQNIERGIINQALMRMKIFEPLYIPYFLLFFDTLLKKNAKAASSGSAIKNIPPFDVLKKYLVPIPPLGEQKRIVAKIEELLPLCRKLVK